MAESEAMPQSIMEQFEEIERNEYIEAKDTYNKDKQAKIKTMKHE
tara:strand:- start:194 stop:328 length:135 start_codon:yes stop_codon:yes gene_type:complete